MATIKVFDVDGVKELKCFDTLSEVNYLDLEPIVDESDEDEDVVDF